MENKLRIELISDMCVSDGGVYNSMLDTDICHDEYGFPHIPSKRIKGCLRECAVELNDWGMNIPILELFGAKGALEDKDGICKSSNIRISNAYLVNYDQMKKEAEKNAGAIIFHPVNVLNNFSYIRTQTAIDYETGVADRNSLRTMRVANKGLIFEADVSFDEKYKEDLEACCSIFTHMGIARTRGLGEVRVSLEPKPTEGNPDDFLLPQHVSYVENANYLQYMVCLEEPIICKSVNGGESRTLDYIEGSKILGLIAQCCRENGGDFKEFLKEGELFCSNAYISFENTRYTEVPANLYSIKNNDEYYVNKSYPLSEKRKRDQLNMMKHCYVLIDRNGNLKKLNVETEERYHHSRPKDKGIGRSVDEKSGDSQFYQISSIKSGQVFQGYIMGSIDQIRRIYDYFGRLDICHIGYSRLAEYGKTRIRITDVKCKEEKQAVVCTDFLVKLEAPTIVYNQNAFYSTSVKDLIDEVNVLLDIKDDQAVVEQYVNYTTVGGYNVTWNRKKPVMEAFDKGTVLQYHLKEPKELVESSALLLGERVTEGFGEASLQILDLSTDKSEGHIIEAGRADERGRSENVTKTIVVDASASALAKEICNELFEDFVNIEAAASVKKISPDSELKSTSARPTVSNMLQMCKECNNLKQVGDAVDDRYGKKSGKKQDKGKYARQILENVVAASSDLPGKFCGQYCVSSYTYDQDKYQIMFLEAYLRQLKYEYRSAETFGKPDMEEA